MGKREKIPGTLGCPKNGQRYPTRDGFVEGGVNIKGGTGTLCRKGADLTSNTLWTTEELVRLDT